MYQINVYMMSCMNLYLNMISCVNLIFVLLNLVLSKFIWTTVRTDSGLSHFSSTVHACPVSQKYCSLAYFIIIIDKISGLQETVKHKGYRRIHLSSYLVE